MVVLLLSVVNMCPLSSLHLQNRYGWDEAYDLRRPRERLVHLADILGRFVVLGRWTGFSALTGANALEAVRSGSEERRVSGNVLFSLSDVNGRAQ